ncbi:hypothetical protein Btru_071648 [Bulinus truncatus]|nr:hypothetical protein Btru_071648 [Bulinus truncatus]
MVLLASQPGDDNCTVRTQSTVYLQALRNYQNITLACFVTNQDFQPSAPDSCNNPTSDLCRQTSYVNVFYPILNVKLTKEHDGRLYEGNTFTLRCYSDGNPPPTYMWTKVGDENTTLTGIMDGSSSTLTLTNLNISDSGTYNCTAWNIVNGVPNKFSDIASLTVYPPTTTTSTTTSTTTKKSTLITSTTSPGTNPADASTGTGDSDKNAIIIGVVVGVGGALIIAIIVAIVCYRRKSKPKSIVDEPAEKTYNNNTPYNINLTNANMNYKNTQPDLVANEKKMNSSSLNSLRSRRVGCVCGGGELSPRGGGNCGLVGWGTVASWSGELCPRGVWNCVLVEGEPCPRGSGELCPLGGGELCPRGGGTKSSWRGNCVLVEGGLCPRGEGNCGLVEVGNCGLVEWGTVSSWNGELCPRGGGELWPRGGGELWPRGVGNM